MENSRKTGHVVLEENDVYFVVPTEGHFVLLKKKEIFLEQNDLTDFWWIS